ncbi:MAG TPA: NAD(P)-binding domain-containing protein [Miltoncostaeaceae bacterium]|nr:NAD(P)-binding domain-containing protein [Miltoncostaeaceae bacterium]
MSPRATVAIMSTGDMGSAVGALLVAGGHRVVTPVGGRDRRTVERAREAGIVALPDLAAAIGEAELIVSVVPPDRALAVAVDVRAASGAARRGAVYLDANSIAPATVGRVADELAATPLELVDGAVYGSSSRLAGHGTVLLSGPAAERVADMVGSALPVRVVGDRVGQASARKMLLAGLTKGLCALILDLAAIADAAGELGPALGDYREFYPGVMELVDRMLPTYRHHGRRRAEELRELAQLAHELGVDAPMLAEAEGVTRRLATPGEGPALLTRVLEDIHASR